MKNKNIYSNWPSFNNKCIQNVNKVLKTGNVNYLTGTKGIEFENKFKKKFNLNFTCAVANGTVALELALLSLNLKKNDEVIVTPRSYNSSASSILKVGAKPVFTDIDLNTYNVDYQGIKANITKNTKAIICVHLYGLPCDMESIIRLANQKNFYVIEDCSQAHGAMINNRYVGSFGDISVWSFCNDKIISTGGEGAMISCKKKFFYEKIWSLKDIGKNKKKYFKNKLNHIYPYMHDFLGTNARITEIQSVIGIEQLDQLDDYLRIRNRNAQILTKFLKKIPSVILPIHDKKFFHAYYRFTISLNFKNIKKKISFKKIIELITSKNIVCNVGGCPEIYKEKPFKNFIPKIKLKNVSLLRNRTISFLVDNTISKKDMNIIGQELEYIFWSISK